MATHRRVFSTGAKLSAELARLPDDALLEPGDLEALGVATVPTLATWRSRRRGPASIILSAGPRYRVGDLRRWIAAGGCNGPLHKHPSAAA